MRRITAPCASPISLAIASLMLQSITALPSHAQDEATLPSVTVTAPKPRDSKTDIGGFGQAPAWQQPLQAERYSDQTLKDAQVQRLSDIVKLDGSISAFYEATGYWDFLSVRGFVLDNAHNYRREGLPINTETSIALENKAAVEVLKGTSGMQAGVSAPGGLVNYVVKRPDGRIRNAELAFTGHRSVLAAVDLSDRFGAQEDIGLRVNVAHEHLNTAIRNTRGERHLLAIAGDWRLDANTLIEAEIEHSRRNQHSVPGFSMQGDTVPLASSIDPKVNLNDQAWAKPVVMRGTTGTLRATHKLGGDWKVVGTLGEQQLQSDDRAAFPFGGLCIDPDYLYCDRFSPDGQFSVYDYRSDGETRITRALDVNASGSIKLGATSHQLTVGGLRSLTRINVPTAAFALSADPGNVSGQFVARENPTYDNAQNVRRERSTELYVRDSARLSDAWRAWGGLRRTEINRRQWLSDDSQPESQTRQAFTTPWLAVGYEFAPQQQVYASWGEGVEVLAPKFSSPYVSYANNGQTLPAVKSRQWEVGLKGQCSPVTNWALGYFHVVRPEAASVAAGADLLYTLDGDARHQGLEGQLRTRLGRYGLDLSALIMDATRRHSSNEAINGKKPSNVPDYTVKMSHRYRVSALPGLALQGDIVHEGPRTADVANEARIPAWTRVDLGLSLAQNLGNQALTWRLGITNLLDTRAWVESPTQFDHIYLLPMAERTVTASLQLSF